jgi:hypothetical protein
MKKLIFFREEKKICTLTQQQKSHQLAIVSKNSDGAPESADNYDSRKKLVVYEIVYNRLYSPV